LALPGGGDVCLLPAVIFVLSAGRRTGLGDKPFRAVGDQQADGHSPVRVTWPTKPNGTSRGEGAVPTPVSAGVRILARHR